MKLNKLKENQLSIDCPHCGHLIKITIEKGEDTLESKREEERRNK